MIRLLFTVRGGDGISIIMMMMILMILISGSNQLIVTVIMTITTSSSSTTFDIHPVIPGIPTRIGDRFGGYRSGSSGGG